MTEAEHLRGIIAHYERVLTEMQGHTFYCEDEDGILRRWYPPAPRPQAKADR